MSTTYEEKRKFNIVDVLIILAILLIAASVIFRSHIINFFNTEITRQECSIYFEAEYVDNASASVLSTDTPLLWIEKNVEFGTIISIFDVQASEMISEDENGNLILTKSDTHSRVTGKINITAVSNNGCYIDGIHFICAGQSLTLSTRSTQFSATITSIMFDS